MGQPRQVKVLTLERVPEDPVSPGSKFRLIDPDFRTLAGRLTEARGCTP